MTRGHYLLAFTLLALLVVASGKEHVSDSNGVAEELGTTFESRKLLNLKDEKDLILSKKQVVVVLPSPPPPKKVIIVKEKPTIVIPKKIDIMKYKDSYGK